MDCKVIAIDLETTGLDPRTCSIVCTGYITDTGYYDVHFEPGVPLIIRRWITDPTKTLVFHNAKFDLAFLHYAGIKWNEIKCKIVCTLVLSKLYNQTGSHKLRDLASQYCNRRTADKDAIDIWLKTNAAKIRATQGRKPSFADAPKKLLRKRVLWDVESTLYLYQVLTKTSPENIKLHDTEMAVSIIAAKMEERGVCIDLEKTRTLLRKSEEGYQSLLKIAKRIAGTFKMQVTRKGEEVTTTVTDFNPRSPKQIEAVCRHLSIPLNSRFQSDRTGNYSFDKHAIAVYIHPKILPAFRKSEEDHWSWQKYFKKLIRLKRKYKLSKRDLLFPVVHKARQLSTLAGTYYGPILRMAVPWWPDRVRNDIGILHCTFVVSGPKTGRFASQKPNLQNQTRSPTGPRQVFRPRPGYTFVFADYKQVEMCLFAHFANDYKMIAAIKDDIHSHTAKAIYGVEEPTKEQRSRAKQINFGIVYGAGADRIAETLTKNFLPTTPSESRELVGEYHRTFPSVRQVTNDIKIQLARKGFIKNTFGRKYTLQPGEAYKGLNYLCQGTSADIIKSAMVRLDRYFAKKEVFLLLQVHDELVFEVANNEVDSAVPKIIELMQDLTTFKVPITVDISTSTTNWAEKQKWQSKK